MPSSSGVHSWVGVVSLICSVLQVIYIGSILWLLRARRRLQRDSRAPPSATPDTNQQHTLTHQGYYQNFLPHSFHSVLPQDEAQLLGGTNVASGAATVPDFSYQTSHTPLGSVVNAGPRSVLGTLPPDMGRMSFSGSMMSGSARANEASLYDEEDPFTSGMPTDHPTSQRQPSILEGDSEDSVSVMVMPVALGNALRGGGDGTSPESDNDMTVSLDGDDPTAGNVGVLVDGMSPGSGMTPSSSRSDGDIQLNISPQQHAPLIISTFSPSSRQQQQQQQQADGAYSLMGDDGVNRPEPPRTQSRHIVHPKSASYGRTDSILQGGGADFGTKRRSLSRRAAAAKAQSRTIIAPTPSTLTSSSGVLIPRVHVLTSASPDPNSSPVRSKVKFADSPRDRKAAGLLAAMKQPQLPFGSGAGETEAAGAAGVTTTGDATKTDPALPRPRERIASVLKHRDPPPPLPTPTPESQLLVLPIYYRFLVLQLMHCALWCVACVVLVAVGTNLIEWDSLAPADDKPVRGSRNWLFGIIMAVLLAVHSAVLDGLLVFLAAKTVGRASIRFSTFFGVAWGIANAVAVLTVVQVVEAPAHPHRGQLPMWHPFFVRSAAALILNLFVFGAPSALVCGTRARRTNMCRKSRHERALALQRQQARWEAASSQGSDGNASDDEFIDEDYDDDTQPRSTWVRLALLNILFHSLVLTFYVLDFSSAGGNGESWERALMILLALGFVANTPVLYYCLVADSGHWAREWKNALRRMKEEAEAEEELRKAVRAEAALKAQREGRLPDAVVVPSKPSAYAAFNSDLTQNFFLDYSVLEYGALLGSGGFSSVYGAKLWGHLEVAVKVLHVRELSKEVVDQFLHEVGIVLQLVHPNVVHFLGVVFSPPDMVLVMERCRRQSLLHLIKQRKVRFTEFQAVSIGLAIADGLRYIHEQDILHRDLKAANILFDMQGRPKICDFGLSEERSKIDLNRVFCGTLAYMSPEVLRSETVGKPSDVYSYSIILWELLHNELAWKRGSGQKNGLNARVLVEMVAYRRARPPVKERLVDDHKKPTVPIVNGQAQGPAHLPHDSARIHPQAFSGDSGDSSASPPPSQSSRPGLHPILVQLLRECWRDDYRRRPSFHDIVRRLSDFREMIRAQQ